MRLRCAWINFPPRWVTVHWLRSDAAALAEPIYDCATCGDAVQPITLIRTAIPCTGCGGERTLRK